MQLEDPRSGALMIAAASTGGVFIEFILGLKKYGKPPEEERTNLREVFWLLQ